MAGPAREMPKVDSMSREEFFQEGWKYEPGEHVSFIGRNGSGKTELAFELMERTATEEMPALVLVMKPRDKTVRRWQKRLEWRIVRSWPPLPSVWKPGKQRGYIIWPLHTRDWEGDRVRHRAIFQSVLRDSYHSKQHRIVFADEVVSLDHEVKLGPDMVHLWTKGRSMECGLWGATQRPAFVAGEMYSAPQHIFLAYDPDKRTTDRYAEIGGVDPDLIKHVLKQLPRWHWLYIRRTDYTMCVVRAD